MKIDSLEELKNSWYKLRQEVRFFLIGCFNALISYCIYSVFCIILGKSEYQVSLIIAWLFSSFVSFNAQKYLVFQSYGNWLTEYLKCCTTWTLSYFLNALFLEICVKILELNIYISQIISTLSVALLTFILFKKYAFNCPGKSRDK